jgi:hypothetical protein
MNLQSDSLTIPTHQSNSTTLEDGTIVITRPTPLTTNSNTHVLSPDSSNSNPMGYQRQGRAQFGHLFGRVTPVRIEQTLHELTTKKGLDGKLVN